MYFFYLDHPNQTMTTVESLDGRTPLTLVVRLLLALSAFLLPPLVENDLGLNRLLQAGHEPLHVVKAVVHKLLKNNTVC